MMSALSDAVAALIANLAKLQTDMNKAFTDLEAAVAAAGGDSADVAAAVTTLRNLLRLGTGRIVRRVGQR